MSSEKLPLTAQDLDRLLAESWIDAKTAVRAGLYRVTSAEGCRLTGQKKAGDYSGIIYPITWPGDGLREVVLRRDYPDLEEKADGSVHEVRKYIFPPKTRNMLLFGPNATPELLADLSVPIVVTEGPKKTLALDRLSVYRTDVPCFLVIGLSGVWNFRGTVGRITKSSNGGTQAVKGVISDFHRLPWKDRRVGILFDSDTKTNGDVRTARARLAEVLRGLQAKPVLIDLPSLKGITKTGADTYLAREGMDAMLKVIGKSIPHNNRTRSTKTSPTTEPVRHIAEVIDEIATLLTLYISWPHPTIPILVAVWVVGTYCYEAFNYWGYLVLRSATPRCGKSKVLKFLSRLVRGTPPVTISPTAAALFRSDQTVLIFDEVDRLKNSDKEAYGEVLAILNAGFEVGGKIPRVEKSTGQSFEVKYYDVYSPKLLAGIEGLADTLADRAFHIQMLRTPTRMPRLRYRQLEPTLEMIRASIEQWVGTYEDDVKAIYSNLPDVLEALKDFDDRFQDIAEPLLVLAKIADHQAQAEAMILPRLVKALTAINSRRLPSGREESFIAFLQLVSGQLPEGKKEDFFETASLLSQCNEVDELAWIENGKMLSAFLKHFDLRPRQSSEKERHRGYLITREWLELWQVRYPKQEELT